MKYKTPHPDDLILPMSDDEYVNWLLKDRYGNNNIELESVLNFYDIISSAAGWEEKELLTLNVLENEKKGV
jgi:hypothetical protein